MFLSHSLADLTGPLYYWGPARPIARTRAAVVPAAAAQDDALPFGDLVGPLAYWGPAPAPSQRPLARVA